MPSRAVPKFICPYCGHETVSAVLETRLARRRRVCLECYGTFSTTEFVNPRQRDAPRHRRPPPEPTLPLFD